MLDRAAVDVAQFHPPVALPDDDHVADVDEEAILDHAGDLVDDQRQLPGIADAVQVQIDDVVAFVGDEGLLAVQPQGCRAAEHIEADQRFLDQRLGGLPAEGHHLHRQREGPQLRDLLGGIGDHDHLVRRGRHDLFLQQRAAAALDQVQMRVEFIGAVDGQVQPFRLVEPDDGDPHRPRQIGGAARGRHAGDPQPLLAHQLAEAAHHPGGGGAGAEPDAHSVLHKVHGAFGGGELGLVDRGKLCGHRSLRVLCRLGL